MKGVQVWIVQPFPLPDLALELDIGHDDDDIHSMCIYLFDINFVNLCHLKCDCRICTLKIEKLNVYFLL